MPVLPALMYFIYSLILALAFLIVLPRFFFDAFRHGKYVAGFRERLGSLSSISIQDRPVIWIHCVSVGETQAARPLVQGFRKRFPDYSIAISTVTRTGQNLARELFNKDVERVFYFPFDWRWIVRRTLNVINPSAVVIMETELWPGFLRECNARRIPVAIVNGRLSEKSFRRYRLIGSFMKRVLSTVNLALMQTEADARRIRALGMSKDKTFVSGNLKFDAGATQAADMVSPEFRERFKFSEDAPLILAASTHFPEERIILEALKQVMSKSESKPRLMPRLTIAPRHPERFAEVAGLIKASGFRWTRRTAAASPSDAHCEVILLDSIGELQAVYSLASIVFVGGSIAKTGGHNILEPAAVGACVITGPHTHNFQLIVETFVKAGAVIQLQRMSDVEASLKLADLISELLTNPVRRQELGKRAERLVNQNRGATERTLDSLASILPSASIAFDQVNCLRVQDVPTA